MERLRDLKVSIDDFKKLRKEGFNYYVDKTFLIKQLVKPSDTSFDINLVLRPRRFGKTLNQSMLAYFFDIKEADNKDLFDDLEIAKDKEYCQKHQNQYPVLFLTFKGLEGKSKESMLERMNSLLSREFIRHKDAIDYLEKDNDKMKFKRLFEGNATYSDFRDSIFIYTEALSKQYNKNVLILLDEYDVPLSYAYNNGFFEEYVDVFRDMLHQSLKSNKYCMGAVITGCLQIAKNQIFTGLNNPNVNTVADCSLMNTAYGFTKKEVQQMLEYYSLQDKMPVIEDWYDGYRFEGCEIYNPFSVMSFMSNLINNLNATPKNYWANTSGNFLLRKMLASCAQNDSIKDKFEALLNNKRVDIKYSTTVTYDDMLKNEAAIFGTLLFSGYLTLDENDRLYIPNKEVLANFEELVNDFNALVAKGVTFNILESFIEKDVEQITNRLRYVLIRTLSVIEEYAYHMLLTGMLGVNQSTDWIILSKRESGEGFPDLIIRNDLNRKAIIIELKVAKDGQEIEAKLDEAQNQIKTRVYDENFLIDDYQVTNYAICFCKKNAKVRLLEN